MKRVALAGLLACGGARPLDPAEVRAPRDEGWPARAAEVDTAYGFGTLTDRTTDARLREVARTFLGALAAESASDTRQLLAQASWLGAARTGSPAEEWIRRFQLHELRSLRGPIERGAFDAIRVRAVDGTRFDVRLPLPDAGGDSPFAGEPVLRVDTTTEPPRIVGYGEE
jgi:hypothetical protein